MPDDELVKAYEVARAEGRLLHYAELIVRARPWWYKANRETKHRNIHAGAVAKRSLDNPGPFPLIYADPPWKFEIYSEKGLERTPDQHELCAGASGTGAGSEKVPTAVGPPIKPQSQIFFPACVNAQQFFAQYPMPACNAMKLTLAPAELGALRLI
jgi:hypothetical protein